MCNPVILPDHVGLGGMQKLNFHFETPKKCFLSVKMRRNFYLSLVQRHKGPFRSNKNLEFSSEYLDVFFQLKTNQRHIYNFIIRSKLKSLKCF